MATTKPRITITLAQEQYDVLARLAKLQKAPMAAIVSDLVGEVTPILERVADSLEIAMKASDSVRANLRRSAEEAEEELRPIAAQVLNQFDLFSAEMKRLVEPEGGTAGPALAGVGAAVGDPAPDEAGGAGPRPVITGATGSQRKRAAGVSKAAAGSRSSASPRAK